MPRTKYRNIRSKKYKGRSYASIQEAESAMWLDSLLQNKQLLAVKSQHPIQIMVNGQKICKHIVDFLITLPDKRQKFYEVKGYPTTVWKLKHKLVKALYPNIPYLINANLEELLK